MEQTKVVVVLGSSPGEKQHPLEVYLDKDGADYHIMKGLLGAFQAHVLTLEPGGTLSLIVNRGPSPTEEQPQPASSGSFVINNPAGERHVWDFTTLFCDAKPRG